VFRVSGLWFRDEDLGCRVGVVGFRIRMVVQGSGIYIQGLGFRVKG
jgi:hypothetical protein